MHTKKIDSPLDATLFGFLWFGTVAAWGAVMVRVTVEVVKLVQAMLPIFLLTLSLALAQAEEPYERFYRAIRSDDLAGLNQLMETGQTPNVSGSQKMTPLHDAALIGSAAALKTLLEHGADVSARNSGGATALFYAAGDLQKTLLLLNHGAWPERTQTAGSAVPLSALVKAASRKGGAATVRALLEKGAGVAEEVLDLALLRAAGVGDVETMALLIEKGASVNGRPAPNTPNTPLMAAVFSRQPAAVRLLLKHGANVRAVMPANAAARVKNGPIDLGSQTALHFAAVYGPPELVTVLLDAGAEINAKDVQGMTPLMWSVASDYQNPEITRMLLARGADPAIRSRDGYTTLDFAKRLGAAAGIEALGGTVEKPAAPAAKKVEKADARTALGKGLGILNRHSSGTFLQTGGCVACHAQIVTQFAARPARRAAAPSDAERRQAQMVQGVLEGVALQGGAGEAFLLSLEAVGLAGEGRQRLADYAVASLMAAQDKDGSWHGNVPRTPIQDGDFTQTALSARMLARYAPPALKAEAARRLEKSRHWLLSARPVTTESSVMRLLGLAAVDASAGDVRKAARAVVTAQRPDGGWAQRPELASDAYATGITLWAMGEAGQLKPTDAAYQQGVKFLLGTQADDGSWHVRSRAVIRFQPYFESGFPYGEDQWISSMGTGWAAKALAIAAEAQAAVPRQR